MVSLGESDLTKKTSDSALEAYMSEREDLLALARAVVGNLHVAEDLVQDSWLRWHNKNYPVNKARPILRRIVSNLAYDWRRRQKTELRFIGIVSRSEEAIPDSERVLIARQDLAATVVALSELPQRTLVAFKMNRIDGLTYVEIGSRLGVSAPRACQMVRRALVHVAARLD